MLNAGPVQIQYWSSVKYNKPAFSQYWDNVEKPLIRFVYGFTSLGTESQQSSQEH